MYQRCPQDRTALSCPVLMSCPEAGQDKNVISVLSCKVSGQGRAGHQDRTGCDVSVLKIVHVVFFS